MLAAYADEKYYVEVYRNGVDAPISGPQFCFYARLATKEIRSRTFGNIDEDSGIPEEVRMCCCEIAEKLHDRDLAKGENGMVMQSFSNDGDTGTFLASEMTQEGLATSIDQIVRSWLLNTGLMFCGRRNRR